jgi:hypothetical protein
VGRVVVIHQLERRRQRAVAAGVAHRRQQEREVAGAVGEDAQVPVHALPEDPQAVAPGEELGEGVVGDGMREGGEAGVEQPAVGQLNGPEAPPHDRVVDHRKALSSGRPFRGSPASSLSLARRQGRAASAPRGVGASSTVALR